MKKLDKVRLWVGATKVWGLLVALIPIMLLVIVIMLGANRC